MRALIIVLVLVTGTFIVFSLGVHHAEQAPYANVAAPVPTQWATSTDPAADPQVSAIPALKDPRP